MNHNVSFLKDIRNIVLVSLFISIYAALSLFTIYITDELRISLTFVPVAWASAAFGPIAGAVTGAFGDVLGWIIRPVGAYHPGFTISGFISGIIYGIFLFKREITWLRVLFTALTMIIIVELGLNTLWLTMLYGNGFMVLLPVRILKAIIMIPFQMLILYATGYFLKRIASSGFYRI
jgi:ECF transporter S component (folate family)